MLLHARVAGVVAAYLEAVDREAPGLVEGLYLTGSTALDDFRPGTSDVDFLAVTTHPPEQGALKGLARAHAQLRRSRRQPHFDGCYVTWEQLARHPGEAGRGPYSYRGRLHARGRRDCDPVAWHTLAQHGIACRGPEPPRVAIWTDGAALCTWTLDNYETYWQPLLHRTRRYLDPWSLAAFTSYGAVWIALGVCRLHYTLATGGIASKLAAGHYGLQAFSSRWHRILEEALRIRRADRARPEIASALTEMIDDLRLRTVADGGCLYPTVVERRNDVLAFADMVIADARRRFAPRTS
jgi:hypothetical protein